MSRIVCHPGAGDTRYEFLNAALGTLLLPDVPLSQVAPISADCRIAFGVRSLREAADYLSSCHPPSGYASDHYRTLVRGHAGTMGAKQALIAMLARECGYPEFQLVVACCGIVPVGEQASALALPLAVCWLKYRDRRLQLGGLRDEAPVIVRLFKEVMIDPINLPLKRLAVYRKFATDWCRVFNLSPRCFRARRASSLLKSAGNGLFEDLLGFGIDSWYEPSPGARFIAPSERTHVT